MDYYEIYLSRLFALGQMDLRLLTLEKEEIYSLSKPRSTPELERSSREAREWFIERLTEQPVGVPCVVLFATRQGFSFCGGRLELSQGPRYLVVGPFYMKEALRSVTDPTLRIFDGIEPVNGFLPLLFEVPYVLTPYRKDDAPYVPIDESFCENDDEAIARNDRLEQQICQAVQQGNLDHLQKILRESFFMKPSHYRAGQNPQRRRQNLCLSLNSVTCRAAIEGGVSPVYARSVCAVIAEKIENATSEAELFEVRRRMFEEYCNLVAQNALKGYSPAVKRCLAYMEQHLSEEISLEQVAEKCKISYAYLSRILKKECGKPYSQLILEMRLKKAKSLLLNQLSVQEAAERTGFKSASYFCKAFKKQEGLTPTDWYTLHHHT